MNIDKPTFIISICCGASIPVLTCYFMGIFNRQEANNGIGIIILIACIGALLTMKKPTK